MYPIAPCTKNTFAKHGYELADLLILYNDYFSIIFYLITVSKLPSEPEISNPECVCQTS
jgi:hypothetical protein